MSFNLPAVEFFAFIALAAWVVYYQWSSSKRQEDDGADTSKPERPNAGEGPPPA